MHVMYVCTAIDACANVCYTGFISSHGLRLAMSIPV